MSICAMLVKSAPVRYCALPDDAYVSWLGFFLARAINSRTFFAGTDGCTTIMLGKSDARVIGAKSFTGS